MFLNGNLVGYFLKGFSVLWFYNICTKRSKVFPLQNMFSIRIKEAKWVNTASETESIHDSSALQNDWQ